MAVRKDNEKDLGIFIKKRFSSIMIPYFWFSLIYIFIVLYSLFISKVVPLKTLFIQLWYVLGMYGMNVLWFLPALFAAEILFVFLTKRFKGTRSVVSILILVFLACAANMLRSSLPNNPAIYERINELIVTLIRPVFACSYIFIGYWIYRAFEMIESRISRYRVLAAAALPVLFVLNFYINTLNRPVDFRSLVFNNYILYYISSVCGSLFIILISFLLSQIHFGKDRDDKKTFRLLKFYGINSLIFMAVHNNSAIMRLSLIASMYVNQFLTRARGYICYGIVILIYLLYVTLTIWLINSFFPFLAGRPMRRKKDLSV